MKLAARSYFNGEYPSANLLAMEGPETEAMTVKANPVYPMGSASRW